MNKLSIIIPVYSDENNLKPLFENLDAELIPFLGEYEIIAVDDGSLDNSLKVLMEFAANRSDLRIIKLARNFGSYAAVLAGMANATGDCCVIKSADLQEPCQLIIDMYNSWKKGSKVVLGLRKSRKDDLVNDAFSNFYYWIMKKTTLKNMPDKGFDTFLLDKHVVNTLKYMNETNSALTLQILWSGYSTDYVFYDREERKVGKSRWTLAKKIKLVVDSMISFSSFPIKFMSGIGVAFSVVAVIWAIIAIVGKLSGSVQVEGWTTLLIVVLFSSGLILLTLGIIGEYLWRTLDAARNRPVYIIDEILEPASDDVSVKKIKP